MQQIDEAHRRLIEGLVAAYKPWQVLEIGVGTGLTSLAILRAMNFNVRGILTCVDNYVDWNGEEPESVTTVRAAGARVVVSDETEFVRKCAADQFDMLISDADHEHAHENVQEYCRIVRPGGFMIFHDISNPDYPNLMQIPEMLSHLPQWFFHQSTRSDEMCERGLWIVVNGRC